MSEDQRYYDAALQQARELGRKEEAAECIKAIQKYADEVLGVALGFDKDEPGDPRTYYQREAAGAMGAIAAIDARSSQRKGKP